MSVYCSEYKINALPICTSVVPDIAYHIKIGITFTSAIFCPARKYLYR
jgi:hypothetical protein